MRLQFIKLEEAQPLTPAEQEELYQRIFDILNRRLFGNDLPPITIYCLEELPDSYNGQGLAAFKYYTDRTQPPVIVLDLQNLPGIGVSKDTILDLFHEMAHYYCYLHGINDHKGKYHNLNFKKAIEEHGGHCSFSSEIDGYNITTLPAEMLREIFNEI